jgi:Nucleotidyl transferase AbiEii toxin, Type IV TA system
MPQLRNQADDLFALITRTSAATEIPAGFVEKDFWATELLRSIIATANAENSLAVFKGGTSLSKGYRLIERYSEDIDILLVPPEESGEAARHGILKRIESAAAKHLGLAETAITVVRSTTGIKRDVRYPYKRRFELGILSEGLLLEMGVRGGPYPRVSMEVDSYVAQFAKYTLKLPVQEFEEFEPVVVEILASERTLVEKLALLHDLASRFPEQSAIDALGRAGRHYYDVYRLLGDVTTCQACGVAKTVEKLAADVDRKSAEFDWPFTPRPTGGYAESPAFNKQHGSYAHARKGFENAAQLIYGEVPSFDECVLRVRERAELL